MYIKVETHRKIYTRPTSLSINLYFNLYHRMILFLLIYMWFFFSLEPDAVFDNFPQCGHSPRSHVRSLSSDPQVTPEGNVIIVFF